MVRCYPPQHFRANIPHNTCFPPSGAAGDGGIPPVTGDFEAFDDATTGRIAFDDGVDSGLILIEDE